MFIKEINEIKYCITKCPMEKNLLILEQMGNIQLFLKLPLLYWSAFPTHQKPLWLIVTVISCSCFRWTAGGLLVSAPCISSFWVPGWRSSSEIGHAHPFDKGQDQVVWALNFAISFKISVWMWHGQAQASPMAVNLDAHFPFLEGDPV